MISFTEIIDDDDGDRKPHANTTFDSSSPSGEADAKAENVIVLLTASKGTITWINITRSRTLSDYNI